MNLRQNYIAFKTILIKEFLRFIRIWIQTVLPPAITMVLYFVIFGNLIGSQIGDIHGFTYMEYIVPGLIMLGIIANAYANVVSSFFGAKFQRHIEEMLVSPTPNYVILLGFIGGGVVRGLTVGAAVFLVSLFFTHLQIHNIFITISVVFLTAVLFSLAGFINGIFARSFDDISIVPTFVLTPLTYLGGIFYSIDMLPPFWQTVSLANPILYMINAFRFGIIGHSDISVTISFGIILGFIAALFMLSLRLLDQGVGIRT
ncbi:MAG: ABC transporter permease [Gammaproteobacteria bacterium]|nr:ABC transporter permease [Gammaproteobacteria bacterium]MBA3732438.1 ABC transporter permease [Gammaproteobacteria bacterium]